MKKLTLLSAVVLCMVSTMALGAYNCPGDFWNPDAGMTLDEYLQFGFDALALNYGEDLGLGTDSSTWDMENLPQLLLGHPELVGDGIKDGWQLQLLAYAICNGQTTIAPQWTANLAQISTLIQFFTEVPAAIDVIAAPTGPMVTMGNALQAVGTGYMNPANAAEFAALQSGTVGVLVAMLGMSVEDATALAATMIGTAGHAPYPGPLAYGMVIAGGAADLLEGAGGDALADYVDAFGLVGPTIAGLWGLDTEMHNTVDFLMGEDVLGLTPALENMALVVQTMLSYAAVWQYVVAPHPELFPVAAAQAANILGPWAATVTAWPDDFVLLGAFPQVPIPDMVIYGSAKNADDPLGGLGDYDGDGVSNGLVAAVIEAQGGGAAEFVAGATNDPTPFWVGNPALPVAGVAGLILLAGALTLGARRALKK